MFAVSSFSQNTQPNQPAASNTNTTTQPAEFKSMRTFTQNGSLQLPKGTTGIMVEVWGAGGGGSSTGGGGGGGYGKAILEVADGSLVNAAVGFGGKGGVGNGAQGGNSSVQYRPASAPASAYTFNASGGNGSYYVTGAGGTATDGAGGAGAYSTGSGVGYYSVCGQDGETYADSYQQSGASTFVVSRYFGKGGDAGNTQFTGGRCDVILNPASPSYRREGTAGKVPGGGGGGSITFRGGGFNGGSGMVIIHY